MENFKPKIVFLGTPEFGASVLEGLVKAGYTPMLIITSPDKPVGRKQILIPSPVKVIAEKYGFSVLQPEKILNSKHQLQAANPDLIILAAYSQILPKEILHIPKQGCLNVHPSLLPSLRGASPIQSAILAGVKETGVTIILMDGKIDHGPIVRNKKLNIKDKKWTWKELEKELAYLGAQLLIETIPQWMKGEIKPAPQDETKATFTKILTKEDGKIDWEKSAQDIEKQVRAFEKFPGSFCSFPQNKKHLRLKILKADVLLQTNQGPTGVFGKTFLAPNNKIAVQTGKDFLLITELQLEGKKPITSEDFLRGHPDFIGTILE